MRRYPRRHSRDRSEIVAIVFLLVLALALVFNIAGPPW